MPNHLLINFFSSVFQVQINGRTDNLIVVADYFYYNPLIKECKVLFGFIRSENRLVKMRFVQFLNKNGVQRLGVQLKLGGDIIDLNAADTSIPNSLITLLNGGKQLIEKVNT